MFTETSIQRGVVLLLRISLGWVFLFAAIRQIPNPEWSAAGFLSNAKTFPWLFDFFASPAMLPIINVLVPWGHLLIGLSLILGLFTRVGAVAGAFLMIMYYLPRLDFPMVGEHNFIVEYHLLYAVVLLYLAAVHAGRVVGLDRWIAELPQLQAFFREHPRLGAALS